MLKRVKLQLLKLVKLQNASVPRATIAAAAAAADDEEDDLESCSGSRCLHTAPVTSLTCVTLNPFHFKPCNTLQFV